METSKILNADILDIIFDGRNQQYGAYDLRKTYSKRLVRAVAVTFGVCLLAIAGGVLANNSGGKKIVPIVTQEVTLSAVNETPPPVVPPPPKVEPKLEVVKFTAPVITTKVVDDPPPAQTDLDVTNIGNFDQKGVKEIAVTAPVDPIGTGEVIAPVKKIDYEEMPTTVQVQAKFPGGLDAWKRFLERNLRQDVPVDNGAPTGDYKVLVSFVVDREGNITDIKAENDPGYGIAAQAVRVIQRSGKWIPALQNGNHVKYRQTQPITFQVNDGQ